MASAEFNLDPTDLVVSIPVNVGVIMGSNDEWVATAVRLRVAQALIERLETEDHKQDD